MPGPLTTVQLEIIDYDRCASCGQVIAAPLDGRWRWAASGKVFSSLAEAQSHAGRLGAGPGGRHHEYIGALDADGRPRIATRRKVAS